MEYRSNSENLFRRYSKILKKQNIEEENQNDFGSEIIEYNQRHTPPIMNKPMDPPQNSRVIVHIGGMQHMLSASDREGEAYIRAVAEKADHMVEVIRQDHPGMPMTNVLTLALVNAVDQLNHSEKNRMDRDTKYDELIEELASVKEEYLKQREINWELKKEVLRINELIRFRENDPDITVQDESRLPLEDLLIRQSEPEDPDERS